MPRPRHIITLTLLITATGWAAAADLRSCRLITDATARLACYDALDATQPARPAATAPTTPDPAFGLRAPASEQPQAIESHIPGRFTGWEAKTRIKLANNQVWEISDGSRGAFDLVDPKVRIRRGALGSYFLEIAGQTRSPRVKRIE